MTRRIILRLVAWTVILALTAALSPARAAGGCQAVAVGPHSPTGLAGCVVYGDGAGPGIARNDCLWPWTRCTPIIISSLDTGRSITVTPTMYGDLYTGTAQQRIVDLDPPAVAALGLNPAAGLWRVRVTPAQPALPNTSTR